MTRLTRRARDQRRLLPRRTVALVSVPLGFAVWSVGMRMGPGPIPLGAWYLLIVAAAGFIVAGVEGDLSWTGLAGLYVGQLVGLSLHAFLAPTDFMDEPLGWLPLFALSFMLAAALGGILGAVLRQWWANGRPHA